MPGMRLSYEHHFPYERLVAAGPGRALAEASWNPWAA